MEHADMALTPAELLQMALDGVPLDGDVTDELGTPGNDDGAAGAGGAAADAAKTDHAGQKQDTDDEPAGAPISSKSGAYSIPYEKLEEARNRAKTLEGENETLRAQITELSAKQQANLERAEEKAQDRADAGQKQTTADQNLDAAKAAIGAGVDVSLRKLRCKVQQPIFSVAASGLGRLSCQPAYACVIFDKNTVIRPEGMLKANIDCPAWQQCCCC